MPESPRWLLVNGKYDRFNSTVRLMAKINGRKVPEDFDARNIETV